MLCDVVRNECPDIEEQRNQNIRNLSGFRKRIQESEKNILLLLAEAKASTILDDVHLINTLEIAKATAIEINEKISENTTIEKQINEKRNSYRKVSNRGSILYFVIQDLSLIDPMY